MNGVDLLTDQFGNLPDLVHSVVDGLSTGELGMRVDPQANSIAWLVWHLTRIQDDHVSDMADTEQAWTARAWYDRSGLPFGRASTGYGDRSSDVAAVGGVDGDLLLGYFDDVYAATTRFLSTLTDGDLDRIVDRNWDPPVTLGVRLGSVLADDLQHVGQAAFVRGVIGRRGS